MATPSRPDPAALARSPLFAGVPRDAVAEAAALGRTRRLARDETLFAQGAPADALHLVLAGQLRVARETEGGERHTLRFVGPGEPAGVLALLGPGQRYPATVTAAADTALLGWAGPALRQLAERHPPILANAMRAMSGRTDEAHARLHEMAAARVERRLALALLRLARQSGRREGEAGAVRIDFPLSRQDIAEMAGTTLATASRVLSAWEQRGVLAGAGRLQVVVKDPAALAALAEG